MHGISTASDGTTTLPVCLLTVHSFRFSLVGFLFHRHIQRIPQPPPARHAHVRTRGPARENESRQSRDEQMCNQNKGWEPALTKCGARLLIAPAPPPHLTNLRGEHEYAEEHACCSHKGRICVYTFRAGACAGGSVGQCVACPVHVTGRQPSVASADSKRSQRDPRRCAQTERGRDAHTLAPSPPPQPRYRQHTPSSPRQRSPAIHDHNYIEDNVGEPSLESELPSSPRIQKNNQSAAIKMDISNTPRNITIEG